MRGFILDQDGNLTVNLSNPFGINDQTINIGDEDHTEAIAIEDLLSSQDSIVL